MSTFFVKPEKLDKIPKPIDESKYFQWKENLIDCANQKADWRGFTSPDYKWIPRNIDRNRGLKEYDENEKKNIIPLNSYINFIATYAPGSLVHDIINESNGNAYIEAKIRSMYQLKTTGSSVFKYFKKCRSFDHAGTQTFQDFYYELRAMKYETLYKSGQSVTLKGSAVTKDEILSPSMENGVVIDWLAAIDADLIEEVEQQYARDLESVSLVDLQEIISQNLPALLSKIKTKKDIGAYKIQLEREVTVATVGYGRRGGRGSGYNKRGQSSKKIVQPKKGGGCTICKSYGFYTRALSHETKDCNSLKSLGQNERGLVAMNINATLDNSEIEALSEEISRLGNTSSSKNDDYNRNGDGFNNEDDPQWLDDQESD